MICFFATNELRETVSHDKIDEIFESIPEEINLTEYIKDEMWNEVELYCIEFTSPLICC